MSLPALSFSSSVTEILVSVTLPVFLTVMVYCTMSPTPVTPFPLSIISASLITSSDAVWSIVVTTRVSRASLICSPVGLFAVTVALLDTMPLLTADWSIVYSTV